MSVLLIESPWDSYLVDGSHRTLAPLGIGYLKSALDSAKHKCYVLTLCADELQSASLKSILLTYKPFDIKVVGLSATTDTFLRCLKIAAAVREVFQQATLVLGGYHATVTGGKYILEQWPDLFDFVIVGEGEIAFPALVTHLDQKTPFYDLPGLSYVSENGIRSNPPRLIEDLNALPLPNRRAISRPKEYTLNEYGLDVSLITSRGCSHNCSFCCIATFFGHTWRTRSIDNILSEVDELVELYGPRFYLHFVDDNFYVNQARAEKIITSIHLRWPEIRFSFATRSDQVIRSHERLKRLKECGVISIELGIENGSQKTLDRFNKKTTVEGNKRALEVLSNIGIDKGIDYILFDHYTTVEDLMLNIAFLKETGLWGYFPPLVYSSLTLYPGTPSADAWTTTEGKSILFDRGTPIEFKEVRIQRIFEFMQSFSSHQPRIFKLMEACFHHEDRENPKVITKYRIAAARLRKLPYQLLEELTILADKWSEAKACSIHEMAVAGIDEIELIFGEKSE